MSALVLRGRSGFPRVGTLTLIGAFFVLSAVLRLGLGADVVLALPDVDSASSDASAESVEPAPENPATLLEALQAREARLKSREEAILVREKALTIADDEIAEKLAELVAAEERLRATLDLARGAAEADVAQLTEVYSRMKPKDAAILFEEMSPEFAAGFLARMKPDIAASVLAGLTPKRAYAISALLAARHSDVPRTSDAEEIELEN